MPNIDKRSKYLPPQHLQTLNMKEQKSNWKNVKKKARQTCRKLVATCSSVIGKQQKHPSSYQLWIRVTATNLNPCLVTSAKHDIVNLHNDDLTNFEMIKLDLRNSRQINLR